jgi:redox-sensitive bicupin YhaK (pirin superfamily)
MSDVEVVIEARPRDLGGFAVGRVLPTVGRRFVGPFVFLDHMGPESVDELAVRPHPHMHLATVTYLFDGEIVHRDSLGSKQTITPGAINWMSAGRGIVHSERVAKDGQKHRVHGLQMWVGLPRAAEDTEPVFVHYAADTLPVIDAGGARVRVLGGAAFGVTSPVRLASPLFYADVTLAAGAGLEIPGGFPERAAYVVDGAVEISGVRIEPRKLAVLAEGTVPVVRAEVASRLVVLGGEPLDGPRYMWWNFVSSSQDRIVEAARAWRAHEFPAVPGDAEYTPAPDPGPRFAKE